MSYILEALRKAERERNVGQVPDLTAVCALPAPPLKRIWPWMLLAAALVINAAVLAWVLLPHEQPAASPTVAAAGTSGAPRQAVTLPRAELTAADFAALAPPVVPKAAPEMPAPPPVKAAKQEPPDAPEIPKNRRAGSVGKELLDNPLAAKPPLPALPAEDDRRLPDVNSPAVTTAKRPTAPPEPPLTSNYAAPELSMDVHVYSDKPNQRFVLINAKRYREGEQLKEGPMVEAITREGALLRYGEQRFMLTLQQR